MSKRLGDIIDCKDKLFLKFSVLVANSKNLLYYYTVAHPAVHGLLNRGKVNKKESLAALPTVVVVKCDACYVCSILSDAG